MYGPARLTEPFYSLLFAGKTGTALERLAAARGAAMRDGEWELVAALSAVTSAVHYWRVEYALALEWQRQAGELVPEMKDQGRHYIAAILKDQGELEQAAQIGQQSVAALAALDDPWGLSLAHLHLGQVYREQGRCQEAEREFQEASVAGTGPSGASFVAILAQAHLAQLLGDQGDAVEFRRLGDQALAAARSRSPFLRALVTLVIYPARSLWGQPAQALELLQEAMAILQEAGAKHAGHIGHLHLARWCREHQDPGGTREHLAGALVPASQEGYSQFLWREHAWTLPLLAEAVRCDIEVAYCQELIVRAGADALPLLAELMAAPEPRARHAALYPLAIQGGERAVALVRHALYDADPTVRDAAILAYRHLFKREPEPAPSAPLSPSAAGPEPAEGGPPIAVSCLGDFLLRVRGAEVRVRTQKSRDLLALFVTQRGQSLTKDRILASLWPEANPDGLQELFHTTLYQLRQALKAAGDDVILFSGGMYRLNRQLVSTDFDRFLSEAGSLDPVAWAAAANRYNGDFLQGLDYEWCEGPRTHFRENYLQLLRKLGRHDMEQDALDRAALWWQRLLEADHLGEEAHLALMQCYCQTGRRSAASQQYRTMVRILRQELGVDPSPTAQAFAKRLFG